MYLTMDLFKTRKNMVNALTKNSQDVFKRVEKKYLLTKQQQESLMCAIKGQFAQDAYGLHTICNLYYDTKDYRLIRTSLEKPVYKEKLRLRSYGIPGESDTVFLELKKKYKGVVYKRRIPLPLHEAQLYLDSGELPSNQEQILREIDWFIHFYHPVAKAYIAYDRIALYGIHDSTLRMTFDSNIRARSTVLDLKKGSWGTPLLPADAVLMELKLPGVMPLWLSHLLSEHEIYPASYSKYGVFYQNHLVKLPDTKGDLLHA